MSAVATAVVVGAGATVYAANKSAKASGQAADAASDAEAARLAFEREQYDRWKSIYGDLEENLGDFYTNLTPDYMTTQGLQAQQQAFQASMVKTKEYFAQTGVESGAQADIFARAELDNAKAKAQIRADAPYKVAEQQQNFLALGTGQGAAVKAGVSSAYDRSGTINALNAQANSYGNLASELGTTTGNLLYDYAKNAALETPPASVDTTASPVYNGTTMNDIFVYGK